MAVEERGPAKPFRLASENRTARYENEADAEIAGAASDESRFRVGKGRREKATGGKSSICG
jgi:hypothetical protein